MAVLKRRFWRITFSQMVSPLLYFFDFRDWAGRMIDSGGQPYPALPDSGPFIHDNDAQQLYFRIHADRVMRLHEKSFESYFYSPTKMYLLATGHILAGALRAIVFWDLHSYSGIRIRGGAFVKRMAAAGRNAQCPDFFRPRIFCGNDYRVALRHE